MKKLHLICNAHLDPVWMWDWDEGATTALATYYSAVELAGEYDYIFCHNEVVLYEYIEKYAPQLFEKIKELVACGKWHIMGGWYIQPDCNLPSGESFLRQIKLGRQYFLEKFGVKPTVAINFDSFGHTRGLVQILKKSGYDGYICCRPMPRLMPLPANPFVWVGYDGSEVKAVRIGDINMYCTGLGNAKNEILRKAEDFKDEEVGIALWGVGNHGGGASRKDLSDIIVLKDEKKGEYEIVHSTPEAYFSEIAPTVKFNRDLLPCFPKTYSSISNIKKKHIELENKLYSTEKICSLADIIYWQYRAERIGYEGDCAGIVNMDGSQKDVTVEIKKFGEQLKRDKKYFVGGIAQKSDVAIVFDFNSMILSEIEDICGPDFEFKPYNPQFYYKNAHTGMYRLLRNSNYNVDYLGVSKLEKFKNYKVLYFPYYTMLEEKVANYIDEFVKGGGTVIADEGFGMRQGNTWMQPYNIACEPTMTARLQSRRLVYGEHVEMCGEKIEIRPYKSIYKVENAETKLCFEDGNPAIQQVKYGNGKIILCGFSLGYSYMEKNSNALENFVGDILSQSGVKKYAFSDVKNDIYERRLINGDKEVVFLFNNSGESRQFNLNCPIISVGGMFEKDGENLVLKPYSMGYAVIKS